MVELIKVYGLIISPIFAFVLGVLTILIKEWFDDFSRKKKTIKSFKKVKLMLKRINLREYEHPLPHNKDREKQRFLDSPTARNMTHFSRYYFHVSAANMFLKSLKDEISKLNNLDLINEYFYLDWRLNLLITKIEEIRDNDTFIDSST